MKLLKTGRQVLSWFCTEAIDEPLNGDQVRWRKIFRFIFKVISTAIFIASNLSLLTHHTSVNDANAFFFGLYQLNITLHGATAVITTFTVGPKLASLFRNLENIYNTCEASSTESYF